MKYTTAILFLSILIVASTTTARQCTVSIGTLQWEPYIGPNMRNNGYVSEIVVEAFKRVDCKADISFYPWARALKLAEQGELDGVFPEYYDKERNIKFAFSEPFPGGPVGLYKRKDTVGSYLTSPQINQTEALKELQEYTFGVVRGYINTAEFDAATFLTKEEADSDAINLKKLYNRRIHFIVIDKNVAEHLIERNFPTFHNELEFMSPPLETRALHIAFSKNAHNYQKKLHAFNRGLREIKEDGTLDRIIKEHSFTKENSKFSAINGN